MEYRFYDKLNKIIEMKKTNKIFLSKLKCYEIINMYWKQEIKAESKL